MASPHSDAPAGRPPAEGRRPGRTTWWTPDYIRARGRPRLRPGVRGPLIVVLGAASAAYGLAQAWQPVIEFYMRSRGDLGAVGWTPRLVIVAYCASLVLAGLLGAGAVGMAVLGTVQSALRALHRSRTRRAMGDVPAWHVDHEWGLSGARVSGLRSIVIVGNGTLLLLPIWAARAAWEYSAALAVLVFVLPVAWVASRLLAASMFGRTRVTYMASPYRPDQPVTVRFGVAEHGTHFENLHFTLRCVRRRPPESFLPEAVVHAMADVHAVTEILHEAEHTLSSRDEVPGPGSDVDVTLPVEPGLPGTDLSSRYPTWWEVEIHGTATAGRYRAVFLLPVYDCPEESGGVLDRLP